MKRCMVDIETLGLEPGSVVLSIGAVIFDENGTYDEFYRNIDMESCQDAGLEIDANTLQWWLEQDAPAQSCLHGGIELSKALQEFLGFYTSNDVYEVWANSPSMDCSVLEEAFDAVNMEEPWEYSDERDFRTLEAVHDIYGKEPEVHVDMVEHNALDDAIYQAKVASAMLRRLHD